MPKRKAKSQTQVNIGIGDIQGVSGEVNVAGRDIYKGYTAEQVSVLLAQITTTFQLKPFDGRCPYKGLDVFEEEDAELFFGRERLIEDLVSRVKESRTVFITGPSGSGKSSLVRAGLIHTLKQGAIKNLHSERWLYETMKPGREPIKDLALAFSRLKSPDLGDYFLAHGSETDILNKCAESVLSGRKDQRFVLFVDQFEEVFTQISQEEERLAFLNMLANAGTMENGRVIVLFAMRSDFVSNCATYPALNELLSQQFRQIGAMQPEELVSAIALPAKHVGLPIEDELIARIINDMKGEPGALPLMQFALKDLFDSQQEMRGVIALRLEDYLKHGGIHKSLERHADHSFAKLNENEQDLARSIFSGLIEIGRGTQDTRRTALFDELVPANTKADEVLAIVQKLADARLIITDEQAGRDTVTISHEKLIDAWPWLKKLVNENRDAIALQNEIASDAKEWDDHQRDPSYLYHGARLATVQEKVKEIGLSKKAEEFVHASIQAEEEAQQKRERTRRGTITSLATGLVTMLFLAIFAGVQWQRAERQAQIALARQLAAQSQNLTLDRLTYVQGGLLAVEAGKRIDEPEIHRALINYLRVSSTEVGRMNYDTWVSSVAFSADGESIASGSADGTARVWQAATGRELARWNYKGGVSSIAFSPDDKYVVASGADGTVKVWEAATGREIARMTSDNSVSSVAFSPNGKYIVSGSNLAARVWEAATGKEVAHMIHNGWVLSVAFSSRGEYVVSGGADGTVRVWDTTSGQEIARMKPDDVVFSMAVSPDDKYIASGNGDGTVRIWEITTGQEIAVMHTYGRVFSVAFSPDGKFVVSGSESGKAQVWIAGRLPEEQDREIARMNHGLPVYSVAFSPKGGYVVSSGADGTARVWDAMTGEQVAGLFNHGIVFSVAFSADGKHIVSGGCDEIIGLNTCPQGTARVWETTTGPEMERMTLEELIAEACKRLPRNLTEVEWKQYFPEEPYVSQQGDATCRNLPLGPELTQTAMP